MASLSAAVVRGSDTLVHRAWGQADLESRKSATASTTYRIGSTSKQFTATLLLQLVDAGRLSLSDSIGQYLTGLRPEWRDIRIEQLLNHTSGLQREFRQANRRTENVPADTLIGFATREAMALAPGSSFLYSNTGYMILGALVEKLYGVPYGQALRDVIARPLKLVGLGWCDDAHVAKHAATGYNREPGGELGPAVFIHISHSLGGGGICATAGDMAAWNQALHGGRVLSRESYAAMTTPRGAAKAGDYGFGLRAQRTAWSTSVLEHSGATPGFVTENVWLPAESLSVTLMYNTTPPPADGGLAMMVARIALGMSPTAPVAVDTTSATVRITDPQRIPGEYQMAPGVGISVLLDGGALFVEQSGRPRRPLQVQADGWFLVGGAGPPLRVSFGIDAAGAVDRMIISQNGTERVLQRVR